MSTPDFLQILEGFHRASVLVLGDVMLDRFIHGSVERISPEAPIPVLAIERANDMLGGAANVARNIATLGARVDLIGVVGGDDGAGQLAEQLAALPTIKPHLIADKSRPTTLKTRYVAERHQVLRTDVESREPLTDAVAARVLERFQEVLKTVDAVILSDYGKGVLSDAVVSAAIAAGRAARKPILVDPKSKSLLKYRGATALTPNRRELQAACGHECARNEDVVAGARQVLASGVCDALVVTRGPDGMSVVSSTSATHIPTVAREVFDVSGAGDTAVATLALALVGGADLENAARLANVAAGIVVGKYGTATVTSGELVARLDQSEDHPKHFTLDRVGELVTRWRAQGLKVAFTNGCFDLLHPGHISLVNQARRSADRLVVGLNSDLSVRRLKGRGRPVQGEVARATVLASLKAVDAVVIFEDDTPLALIDALRPDVLVKGADYRVETVVGAELVISRGGKVVLAELVPEQSTTNTIERISAASASGVA